MALKIIYRQLKTLNIVTAVTRNQVPVRIFWSVFRHLFKNSARFKCLILLVKKKKSINKTRFKIFHIGKK